MAGPGRGEKAVMTGQGAARLAVSAVRGAVQPLRRDERGSKEKMPGQYGAPAVIMMESGLLASAG